MTIPEYLMYSAVGLAVVFFTLFLLMIMVKVMTKVIPAENKANKAVIEPEISRPIVSAVPSDSSNVKLYNTDPRTAAMIMAIVADQIDIPVEQLKFISIKEVEK